MHCRSIRAASAVLAACAGLVRAQSYTETFDAIEALAGSGWQIVNNSEPPGSNAWFPGNPNYFPGQTGGYIAANPNAVAGVGTISLWLLSPTRTLANGDTFQFWTRRPNFPEHPDRLQVRLSTAGSSANVGTTATSVGVFSTLLLDLNPAYTATGYPQTWQQFTLTVSGLAAPTPGRFALRYFVEDGGALGTNALYIGIDHAEYTAGGVPTGACCTPSGACMMTTAAGCASVEGVFNGLGTACKTVVCPAPGACCFVNGTCLPLNATQCTNQGGVYMGNGTVCATANCPLPGACCKPDLTCFVGTASQCAAVNGAYRGDGTTCATANCPQPGACCLPSGACAILLESPCLAQNGVFQGQGVSCVGANCPQPPTGACCVDSGCLILTQANCLAQNGLYRGDLSVCATANCPPNLVVNGGFEAASFAGWTQFGSTASTGLTTGPVHGGFFAAFFGPPTPGGIRQTVPLATGQAVVVEFWYLAQGTTNSFSAKFDGATLVSYINDTSHTAWTQHRYEVTTAAQDPVIEFTFTNPLARTYLDGVRVYPNLPACYANCDGSTLAPVLNVADFTCFLNSFAAGASYANCDGSTVAPVLNVADFTCFLNRFSAGCS